MGSRLTPAELNARRMDRARRRLVNGINAVRTAELLLANRKRELEEARDEALAAGFGREAIAELLQ